MSEKIHERIWLQFDSEWDGEEQTTWCSDKINDNDVEYILRSTAEQLVDALLGARETIEDWKNDSPQLPAGERAILFTQLDGLVDYIDIALAKNWRHCDREI